MSRVINAQEVMEILRIGQSTAYRVIRELQGEMKNEGYRTVKGKISLDWLCEQYNLNSEYCERQLTKGGN